LINSFLNSLPFQKFISNDTNCKTYEELAFSTPHYNSFVDLDGDCRADLFITSLKDDKIFFEYWINKNEKDQETKGSFCLINKTEAGPAGEIKGIAFADIGLYFKFRKLIHSKIIRFRWRHRYGGCPAKRRKCNFRAAF
jgi:hypothetical protein